MNGLDDDEDRVPEVSEENMDEKHPEEGVTIQSTIPQQEVATFPNNYATPMQYAPIPYEGYGYYPPMPQIPYAPYPPCLYYPVPAPAPFYLPPEVHTNEDDVVNKLLFNIEKALNDQSSCRLIQKKLEEENIEERNTIANKLFGKMINKIEEYMNLPFGNYLCQKLFELLSQKQVSTVTTRIRPHLTSIANNLHGTRSVQKLIEISLKYEELMPEIEALLSTHIPELVMVPLFSEPFCRTLTEITLCSNV